MFYIFKEYVFLPPMPARLLPREEVVNRLVTVFRRLGYEGASLTELSKGTGLGRSSLYHYFPGGKEDMARAALGQLGDWVNSHLIQPLQGSGTPQERLEQMVTELDSLYAQGQMACLLGMLVQGGSRQLFQDQLRDSFNALIQALVNLSVESGLGATMAQHRAEEAVLRIQGALILAGGLDDNGPFQRVMAQLRREFLAP